MIWLGLLFLLAATFALPCLLLGRLLARALIWRAEPKREP